MPLLVALPTSGFAYLLLFALVGGESAGLPLPGETALITGGVLASQGKLSVPLVIVVAAAGAIIGDNIGYFLGRQGARRLLVRPGWMEERRRALVTRGEAFFEAHGAKTVFFGRWLPFLRVTAAWLAGAHRMHWATFLVWNAAGGISWAISVGLLAYFTGHVVLAVVNTAGYVAIGLVAIAVASVLLWGLGRWYLARSSASDGSR
jgi:membrane protein DedA with SNARE-associated domain